MENPPARPAPPPLATLPPAPVEPAPEPAPEVEAPAVTLSSQNDSTVPKSEQELDRIVKDQVQREMARQEEHTDRTALKLNDLQRAQFEAADWRWKAMKARAALAEKTAQDAAQDRDDAYEAMMALCRSFGIDTARNFRIDQKNRVTYPMGGPARPDFAPPEGKTVKR